MASSAGKRKKTSIVSESAASLAIKTFASSQQIAMASSAGKWKKTSIVSESADRVHLDEATRVPTSDLEKKAIDAMMNNNFLRAEYFYSEAISRFPDNAELFAGRAEARIKLENFADAVADADIATRLDSSMAKAHVRKGIAYSNLANKSFQVAAALPQCDTKIELREQVWTQIQAAQNRYMPVLADLYVQVCHKLDKTRPIDHLVFLRKFLVDKMTFLMVDKSRISLTADVGRFERNLLKFFSKTAKLYGGYISLKCLETLQTS